MEQATTGKCGGSGGDSSRKRNTSSGKISPVGSKDGRRMSPEKRQILSHAPKLIQSPLSTRNQQLYAANFPPSRSRQRKKGKQQTTKRAPSVRPCEGPCLPGRTPTTTASTVVLAASAVVVSQSVSPACSRHKFPSTDRIVWSMVVPSGVFRKEFPF